MSLWKWEEIQKVLRNEYRVVTAEFGKDFSLSNKCNMHKFYVDYQKSSLRLVTLPGLITAIYCLCDKKQISRAIQWLLGDQILTKVSEDF